MNTMAMEWDRRCMAFARSDVVTTRLGVALDPACGTTALRYMAEHDPDQRVRDAAAQMMQRREMDHLHPLFGDAD